MTSKKRTARVRNKTDAADVAEGDVAQGRTAERSGSKSPGAAKAPSKKGGSRRSSPAKEKAPPAVEKQSVKDGAVPVKPSAPKTVAGCSNPIKLGADYLVELHQSLVDIADYIVSPLTPGPFLTSMDGQSAQNVARVDRLWELRLCIEMLRDCFESYDSSSGRDVLSSPEETLTAVEETLCRITELSFVHSLDACGPRADPKERESTAMMMEAVQSKDFKRGGLTQCLLSSRLGISGLLQAVLGELTDWQSRPSEAELRVWKKWDRQYEELALSVGRGSVGNTNNRSDLLVTAVQCCEAPCCLSRPVRDVVERQDARRARCGGLL